MRGSLLIDFWVSGKPEGLPRPRASLMWRDSTGKNRRWFPTDTDPKLRKNVFVSIHTPSKKGDMKALVQGYSFQAMRAAGIFKPIQREVPLIIDAAFVFGPNRSDTKKLTAAKEAMLIGHTKKPDVDNIGKGLLDGMTDAVYVDDTQIVGLQLFKVYGPVSGLRCRVYEAVMADMPEHLNEAFPNGICV